MNNYFYICIYCITHLTNKIRLNNLTEAYLTFYLKYESSRYSSSFLLFFLFDSELYDNRYYHFFLNVIIILHNCKWKKMERKLIMYSLAGFHSP